MIRGNLTHQALSDLDNLSSLESLGLSWTLPISKETVWSTGSAAERPFGHSVERVIAQTRSSTCHRCCLRTWSLPIPPPSCDCHEPRQHPLCTLSCDETEETLQVYKWDKNEKGKIKIIHKTQSKENFFLLLLLPNEICCTNNRIIATSKRELT